jgi:hypothetical protein
MAVPSIQSVEKGLSCPFSTRRARHMSVRGSAKSNTFGI